VLVLNSYTRWGLAELTELEPGELLAWLDAVPAVYRR